MATHLAKNDLTSKYASSSTPHEAPSTKAYENSRKMNQIGGLKQLKIEPLRKKLNNLTTNTARRMGDELRRIG